MMKDAIFEAADAVIESHGVDGLTMDRVAAKAGLATGSLYKYFKNKNDLMQFVQVRLVEPLMETMREAVTSDVSAPQKLERILMATFDCAVKHRGLLRLLRGTYQGAKVKMNACPLILELFTDVFKRGIEDGTFRQHNPQYTAHMLLGCLLQMFELQAGGASVEQVGEYVRVLIDTVHYGFSILPKSSGHVNVVGVDLPPR
jgi:AcrR family transcriptional regulator